MFGNTLPPHIIAPFLFVFCLLFLLPGILYILTLQRALERCGPVSRTMQPGMVWLLLIPLFNLIWNFFVVLGLARSLANEFARRGIPVPEPEPGQSIGMAMSICACCGLIPVLGVLASFASLVLWIMYWVKIAGYSQALAQSSATLVSPPLNP